MTLLGNIIWILFGGLVTALYWFAIGCLFCLTIVGIPLGRQAFKMASLSLAPFGKEIRYGGGAPSFVANVIWLVLAGLPMALGYLLAGALNCATIIGIPFGLQSFKMAKLALLPFGARVI
ncbi:MAG: YccF domain-containing protein [Collinsella sp.]|nr:YccF domain-containing protein [Collinsella sp.]